MNTSEMSFISNIDHYHLSNNKNIPILKIFILEVFIRTQKASIYQYRNTPQHVMLSNVFMISRITTFCFTAKFGFFTFKTNYSLNLEFVNQEILRTWRVWIMMSCKYYVTKTKNSLEVIIMDRLITSKMITNCDQCQIYISTSIHVIYILRIQ